MLRDILFPEHSGQKNDAPSLLHHAGRLRTSGLLHAAFWTLILLLPLACAQEGAPPGGPTDTNPPYILEFSPPGGSTRVPVAAAPVISFNERMDMTSVQDAVFIVPIVSYRLKTNWGGDRITVAFEETLRTDQTYVVTIGTGARDMRGNRMSQSKVYTFSTGEVIDMGEIAGHAALGTQNAAGAFVWAYNLNGKPEPNPADTPPDYIVQTGTDGAFVFSGLSPGRYRLFAFQDRGRDRRYDPGQDAIGAPAKDITLQDGPLNRPVRIQLSVRDTTALALSRVRATYTSQVSVRFNKPVDVSAFLPLDRIHIMREGTRLQVLDVYRAPQDSSSVIIITEPQTPDAEYTLNLDSGLTERFTGSSLPDNIPPELFRVIPPDSARQVDLTTSVVLIFSEAVNVDSGGLTLTDSSFTPIPSTMERISPVMIRIQPDTTLAPTTEYRILIASSKTRDYAGRTLKRNSPDQDTLIYRFFTVDPGLYGSISGTVVDEDTTGIGEIILTLIPAQKDAMPVETRIPGPGAFRFDRTLPGWYSLHGFRDANGNGRLDNGSIYPFVPAERAAASVDSILTRGGWESADVTIRLYP